MKFAVITMKNGMPNYAVSDVNPVKHPFNEDDTLFVVTKCIGGQLSEHWFTTSQVDAETAFCAQRGQSCCTCRRCVEKG